MADKIRGLVIEVIDGDTFSLKVTWQSRRNEYTYNEYERIRLFGVDAAEINTREGKIAKAKLERKLLGKDVECIIQFRDTYGRLHAKVYIL